MSTWSGIRNKLESDYLCPALRGHIQYFATSYSKSADHEGRAAIRVDGVEVLRSNYYTYFENVWTKFHHLRSTTLKDCDSAKEAINQAHAYALEQGTFDQKVFYEAFGIFDNQSIEKSLTSENPLVRIFALLDRRLGKRRLLALEESMEQELDWVRAFYVIRMQAEGLIDVEEQFTTIHNYIDTDAMILRKGAVSAKEGEQLLIPINMRDGSLLCVGKGNEDWNCSAPHGAGRLMSRADAKQSFTVSEFKKQMAEVYTTSVNKATLDECPMAYKGMQDILDNIGPTADVVKVIRPIYNFKAGDEE